MTTNACKRVERLMVKRRCLQASKYSPHKNPNETRVTLSVYFGFVPQLLAACSAALSSSADPELCLIWQQLMVPLSLTVTVNNTLPCVPVFWAFMGYFLLRLTVATNRGFHWRHYQVPLWGYQALYFAWVYLFLLCFLYFDYLCFDCYL